MSVSLRSGWHRRLPRHDAPRYLRQWLLDEGSLTARLQRRGRFSLELLAQELDTPSADEALLFGLVPGQKARIREVALAVDGRPFVFAHTVLPIRPRGPVTGWLARLGKRSLGSMLFSRPGFERGALSCCRLDSRHPLYIPAMMALGLSGSAPLWARRSCFRFGQQQVLVTEVFSPELSASPPPTASRYENATMRVDAEPPGLL